MSALEVVWAEATKSCAYRNVEVPACALAAKDEVAAAVESACPGCVAGASQDEARTLSLLLQRCLVPCGDSTCASRSRVPAVRVAPNTGSDPSTTADDGSDDDSETSSDAVALATRRRLHVLAHRA
jgi:hypothetical protein